MNKIFKKKIIIIIFFLIYLFSSMSVNKTYAYWHEEINNENAKIIDKVLIDKWNTISKDPEVILKDWIFTKENIKFGEPKYNTTINKNQKFIYNDLIFISISDNYNPTWNGLPGDGNNQWAFVSTNLLWMEGMNYKANSIVKIIDKHSNVKYYITNTIYQQSNYYVNNPLDSTNDCWHSEWLEIEAIDEEAFELFEDLNIFDYTKYKNNIIYKNNKCKK